MKSKNDEKYVQDDIIMSVILQCDIMAGKWKWFCTDLGTGWKRWLVGIDAQYKGPYGSSREISKIFKNCSKFKFIFLLKQISACMCVSLSVSLSLLHLSLVVGQFLNHWEPLNIGQEKWTMINPNWCISHVASPLPSTSWEFRENFFD